MNCSETAECGTTQAAKSVIQLPLGLLGFEHIKKYVILSNPDEAPFIWLQVMDEPSLAFLAAPASEIVANYRPDISKDDAEFLGLSRPEDALVLNIVTLQKNNQATANLRGPVVLNRLTGIAKQIIPMNASEYSLQHPLGS